jgi:hypothetical protein
MTPDPRWLEILKASGWQTMAIAAACGLFLSLAYWGWLPPLEAWMVHLAAIVLLVCGFLAIASAVSAFFKFFPPNKWILHYVSVWRRRRDLRNYIPHMTEHERNIIAYLLHYNQKMFTAEADGGYAVTLISRGIVVRAMVSGQQAAADDVPFAIPDELWSVLQKHKDKFPHKLPPHGEVDAYPWRIPWQLR